MAPQTLPDQALTSTRMSTKVQVVALAPKAGIQKLSNFQSLTFSTLIRQFNWFKASKSSTSNKAFNNSELCWQL